MRRGAGRSLRKRRKVDSDEEGDGEEAEEEVVVLPAGEAEEEDDDEGEEQEGNGGGAAAAGSFGAGGQPLTMHAALFTIMNLFDSAGGTRGGTGITVTDEALREAFPPGVYGSAPVMAALNQLLASSRLQALKERSGRIVGYVRVDDDVAAQLCKLDSEQKLVYDVIMRVGNKGIWQREIKQATTLSTQHLGKILKALTSRQLIKSVKTVSVPTKRVYMLYNLKPSKEVTGGPWYKEEGEFDMDYVDSLRRDIVTELANSTPPLATTLQLYHKLEQAGIFQGEKEVTVGEVQTVIDTLVYDGRLERVSLSLVEHVLGRRIFDEVGYYRPVHRPMPHHTLLSVPCGRCPVVDQCTPGGLICPETCVYMRQWIHVSRQDMDGSGASEGPGTAAAAAGAGRGQDEKTGRGMNGAAAAVAGSATGPADTLFTEGALNPLSSAWSDEWF